MRNSAGLPQGRLKGKMLPLIGIGWLRAGVSISNAGDVATGGDTNGAYIMPADKSSFFDLMNINSLPDYTAAGVPLDGCLWGCQSIAIAPTDGNVGIVVRNNTLYHSTNLLSDAPTLTKIGGPYPAAEFNSNLGGSFAWRRAVFSPVSTDVFLLGSMGDHLYYSLDGGTTLNTLTVDTPGSYGGSPCFHCVAFDPTSTIVNGEPQTVYYSTYGVGVKRSTTGIAGLATASVVTGSPTNVNSLKVDAAGNVYALNAGESSGGNLYKASSTGSFSKCSGMVNNEFWDVAINPQNVNQVIVTQFQATVFQASMNGGATWLGNDIWNASYPTDMTLTPSSARWMMSRDSGGKSTLAPKRTFGGQSGNIEFDSTGTYLYMATGQGLLRAKPPTTWGTANSSGWHWEEVSNGISQAVISDVYTPPGGKPILSCGDFGIFKNYDDTGSGMTSTLPQIGGQGNSDNTVWSVEGAPSPNDNFLVAQVSYHGNAHAYSTDYGDTWTLMNVGAMPQPSIGYGGGVLLAASTSDFYSWHNSNVRPISTHDGGESWGYEDINMAGVPTKARRYIGSIGTSLLIVESVAEWDSTGHQQYTITLNAPSGTGSVTATGSGSSTVITITPPSTATTAAQIAAYINGNSTASPLISVSTWSGGGGTVSSFSTGTMSFTSGWGSAGLGWNEPTRNACIDKTNGNIYCYNTGDDNLGLSAPWAGIWKRDHTSGTWSKVSGLPDNVRSGTGGNNLREIIGQTDHMLFHGQTLSPFSSAALYRTTDGWNSYSKVGDASGNFFDAVLWAHAGKAATGQTYPAVYVIGTLNGVTAMWACFDGSWTNWVEYGSIYAADSVYNLGRFCAHPDIFGRIDGAFVGAGGYIGLPDNELESS